MATEKIIRYQTDAKKAAPELEKLKAEKLQADRNLSEERLLLVETQRKLREMEYKRRRGELVEQKAVVRYVSYAYTCLKERLRALPSAATRKLDIPAAEKHAARMLIDVKVREALTELADHLNMTVAEYQKRIERA